MKKKQFIMCLLILLTSFSYAQTVFIDNFIIYEVNDDTNSLTVIDYNTAGGTEVVIPSSVNNSGNTYNVATIGSSSFRDNQLTSVRIPNSVTNIGRFAFENNKLTSVNIPNSVTSIGHNAFANNQLTSVIIPNSVTSIDFNVFSNNQLTSVSIPNSITSIDGGAFENNQLTNITIPNSVTNIGYSAFANNQLRNVISEDLNPPKIDTSVFKNNLEIELRIPEGTSDCYIESGWIGFKSIDEGGATLENLSFTNEGLEYTVTSIEQNYVTVLGRNSENTNMDINIPQQVTHNNITYTVIAIIDRAFQDNQLTNVSIPNSVISIGSSAFASNELTSISIPNSLTRIEEGTFRNNQLTDVSIPDSVTTIGSGAFEDNQLTSVSIPNSITWIRNSAFEDNQLTSVSIPNSIIWIGNSAFEDNQLTSISIPNSVTFIGANTFRNNQLTNVTIPSSVTRIGQGGVFLNNPLTNLSLESEVPLQVLSERFILGDLKDIDLIVPQGFINTYLEAGYTGFKSISDGTTNLSNLSFTAGGVDYHINNTERNTLAVIGKTENNNAKDIIIPETVSHNNIVYTVTRIEENAFNRNELTSVTMPNSVESIGWQAFRSNQLTNITIPNSVTSIGRDAFRSNRLTSVTTPNTVTSIGADAFNNNMLIRIVSLSEVPVPLSDVFKGSLNFTLNNREDVDLVVPQGFIDTYLQAGWIGFKSISDGSSTLSNLPITSNGFNYRINSATANTVTVLGKTSENNDTEITIPETVTHNNIAYTINTIGDFAFRRDRLSSISIPNSVTYIGQSAFSNNQLTNIDIPSSVTSIEESAFFNNELTSVTIPGNVTTIGRDAFDSNQITEVTSLSNNPASLLENNNSTFGKNSNIDLTIPNNTLSTYENNAWTGFKSVTESSVLSTEAFEKADNKINFKNPVASQLQIFTNASIKLIKIYDMSGKKLLESTDLNNVAVENLQSGMYIIHFTTDKEVVAKRMLKE